MNDKKKKIEEKAVELVASVWPGLHLEKRLGKGAYGSVYECVRTDVTAGLTTREALKIIDMTFEDVESIADELGTTPESYYQNQKKQAIDEIRIMYQLKGPHIVHINDFHIVEKGNLEGFYILIRMDLLTSLFDVMKEHIEDKQARAEELAKKVALDICDALILCQKEHVIHRDIKPQNVFMSDNGEFYLGDFGVAKSLSGLMSTLSYKGTAQYIAPEVALGNYDHRADLYSLGLLLYQLLNHRRMPFCPAHPNIQTAEDGNIASKRRFAGEPVPAPDNCSPAFAKIVMKLCQHNPDNRYKDAEELKEAILSLNQTKQTQKAAVPASKNPAQKAAESFARSQTAETIRPAAESFNAGSGNSVSVANRPAVESLNPGSGNSGASINSPAASGAPRQNAGSFSDTSRNRNAVPQKLPDAIPAPQKQKSNPPKKEIPIWAIAAVITVIVAIGAIFLGRTVFAPKNDDGAPAANLDASKESSASSHSDEGVKLTSLSIVENEGAEIRKDVTNSLNQTFDEAVIVLGWYTIPYARFYVQDYERLVGNFSCPDENVQSGEAFRLSIYLDDSVDSPVQTIDISRTTTVTPLDIDLSGADFITFQLENTEGSHTGLLLTDCFLYSDASAVDAAALANDKDTSTQADNSPAGSEGIKLTSLSIVESLGAEVKKDVSNTLGETFREAVSVLGWYDSPYVRFYVRDYERLIGNFSCPEEGVDSPSRFRLTIYLDDAVDSPLQTIDMSRSTAPTPLDIDLSGADFITFHLENTEGTRTGLLLTDCFVYSDASAADAAAQANNKGTNPQAGNTPAGSDGTRLTSLNIVENLGAEVKKDVSNTLGETFREAVSVLGWYESPYVRFYVRDYERFIGNFSCPEEGVDSPSRFRLTIYLDDAVDSPLQTIDMSRSTAPTPLDIDLSGADFITFQLENTEGTRTGLLLTDCFVY